MSEMDDRAKKRFWNKVEVRGEYECWPWQAARSPKGHGAFRLGDRTVRAHRCAFEQFWECAVPPGLEVCHDCPGGDNPACCNPRHLFIARSKEHAEDRVTKGQIASGERAGPSKLNGWSACGVMARVLMGVNQRQVAREFGVAQSTVAPLALGKTWKSLFDNQEVLDV